jgi:hypothetical protein
VANGNVLADAGASRLAARSVSFSFAGVPLVLETGDEALLQAVASALGASSPPTNERAGLHCVIDGPEANGWGRIRLTADDPASLVDDDLRLGLESPEFPFERRANDNADVLALAFWGDAEPVLVCQGAEVRFRAVAGWRKAVAFLLLHRLVRLRADALFFHAASVGISGRGALLIGPKGAGKSTLALALAARGHDFQGDETACYLPAAGTIIPLRRPVGIKPGPRARVVDDALARARPRMELDGMMRIDVEALLDVAPPRALPLRAVLFLDGFESEPRVEPATPSRDDLARLQPFSSSLVAAPRAQRVFEMARLLGAVRVFRVRHGEPDATAERVAHALGTAWA